VVTLMSFNFIRGDGLRDSIARKIETYVTRKAGEAGLSAWRFARMDHRLPTSHVAASAPFGFSPACRASYRSAPRGVTWSQVPPSSANGINHLPSRPAGRKRSPLGDVLESPPFFATLEHTH